MRKLLFVGIVALGAALGLLTAVDDEWSVRIVMAFLGVLFATPVAAVLTRRKDSHVEFRGWDEALEIGASTSPRALAANFWRDKGHPPFMKPPEAEPDRHVFDPDKQG